MPGEFAKIKAAQPDVVILDVQLPDGDGIILQEIKSQLGIPVIMRLFMKKVESEL